MQPTSASSYKSTVTVTLTASQTLDSSTTDSYVFKLTLIDCSIRYLGQGNPTTLAYAIDAGLPVTYTLNKNSVTPSECSYNGRAHTIQGLATVNVATSMSNLSWLSESLSMTAYLLDLTAIDTTNIADPSQPIYEGQNAWSFIRNDSWTSSPVTDLSIDIWLCKITPPAILSADVAIDTSDPSISTLEIPVNSFSLTADSSCGTLYYEVETTVITSDKVTYDDSTKKLTFTETQNYPIGDILVTMKVW